MDDGWWGMDGGGWMVGDGGWGMDGGGWVRRQRAAAVQNEERFGHASFAAVGGLLRPRTGALRNTAVPGRSGGLSHSTGPNGRGLKSKLRGIEPGVYRTRLRPRTGAL